MATTTLKVEGMTCGACTSSVESAFKDIDGVGDVSVSLVMERAVVVHDPEKVPAEKVREMIEDRGFDAEVLSSDMPEAATAATEEEDEGQTEEEDGEGGSLFVTELSVGGMTCGACTSAVEGAFKGVPGVVSFSISLLSERAVVEHDAQLLAPNRIAEIIEDTGFDASIIDTKQAPRKIAPKKSRRKPSSAPTVTTTVAIEGMTCGACTSAVESGFKDVDGVVQFNISLLAERAVIVHDPAKLSASKIAEIIEDRGFDAKVLQSIESSASAAVSTAHFKMFGMPDAKAAMDLESSLKSLPGVTAATVNFGTSRATISHKRASIGLRALVEHIEGAGFNALVADAEDNNSQLESLAKTKEIQEWRNAFRTSLCFAIPVFLTSMFFPMCLRFLDYGRFQLIPGLYLGDVVCLALTIPVQFGIGKRFYISAYKSLRHASPTMDVLVVLGTSTAFFFSCAAMIVSIITPPHSRPGTVFDTSTMLITFITLGRYIENRAKGQTSKALSRLMSLAPSMATIYADPIAATKAAEAWNNQEVKVSGESSLDSVEQKTIPSELIEVGDVVILRPGDKIPADGTIISGESYVDESMVTGEAIPILKKHGSHVMAGTVNSAGRLDFAVTRAGRDTQLSQIVRLVQSAQTSRAPIQRMADVVAGYFVPIIITLGLSTFVAWMVLSHVLADPPTIFMDEESGGKLMVCVKLCISVIVFACPCALGLSTPTAIMVGTGVGAENGILIKGGAALEKATKISHVVLDKTGTLTVGKMSVSETSLTKDWTESPERIRLWWTLVGLTEMGSEHPIAKAIVLAAKEQLGVGPEGSFDGSIGDFEATVGKGVSATVEAAMSSGRERHRVVVGNSSYLRSQGIEVPASAEADPKSALTTPTTPTAPRRPHSGKGPSAGTTTIHTAVYPNYTGTLALSDSLKPAARATVQALARLRISCSIVTGDALEPALVVASQVGIPPENVHASATPADKQRIIEELQVPTAQGGPGELVAMVGDGINDSPALATSAIGIALASGTDVAMEAASIVLMKPDDLLSVPASLHLSQAIFRRIKLNLLWACVYNVVGLPFAMGFFLPWGLSLHPMAAGAAMACSSVSVVASSLALRWWGRPGWMRVAVLDPAAGIDEEVEYNVKPSHRPGLVHEWIVQAREWMRGGKRNRRGEDDRDGVGYVPLRDMGDV
ncbi:E1-E2 ATPase-domain-containing protein [Lineolata rhizophorae]|uniref:P-type Cu(+) transporter n=1 Tax=Lineolata rhizophorae TaxID=578093 RepID=A0A6A6NSL1_9PEZI|nr:E1-E2 ATPase-domain-containing protein [Lineolata rhizophorae]